MTITEAIVSNIKDACHKVFDVVGPGHSERVYHNAVCHHLRLNQWMCESEVVIPVVYKTAQVGSVRADLVVDKKVVVEFKATTNAPKDADVQQLHKYLRLLNIHTGMVINFNVDGVQFICSELT